MVRLRKAGKCKVCNSLNRIHYEVLFFRSLGNLSSRQMEKEANKLGEKISYRTFARHFSNPKHYDAEKIEQLLNEEKIRVKISAEEEEKSETINVLQSFKANLKDLKVLIDRTKNLPKLTPHAITAIGNLIKHHTELLEKIEKERESLSLRTTMSEAEMIKLMSQAAAILCQECRRKLWSFLNDQLDKS